MKKAVLLAVLLAVIFVALPPVSAPVSAFDMPAICALSMYGPQYASACIVQICMELWIDPLDYLI